MYRLSRMQRRMLIQLTYGQRSYHLLRKETAKGLGIAGMPRPGEWFIRGTDKPCAAPEDYPQAFVVSFSRSLDNLIDKRLVEQGDWDWGRSRGDHKNTPVQISAEGLLRLTTSDQKLLTIARAEDDARREQESKESSDRMRAYFEHMQSYSDRHPGATTAKVERGVLREQRDALHLENRGQQFRPSPGVIYL